MAYTETRALENLWRWVELVSPDGKGGALVPPDVAIDVLALNSGWSRKAPTQLVRRRLASAKRPSRLSVHNRARGT